MADAFQDDVLVGGAIMPCPLRKLRTHWIEIELVGENDKPIAWVAYQVRLPDQTIIDGFLDANGYARLDGLEQGGSCAIHFPELDKDAWTFINTVGSRE